MKKFVIATTFLFLFVPIFANADELYYASVVDLVGGNMLLKYNTTEAAEEGELFTACDIDTAECGELSEEQGDAFDAPVKYTHRLSPDGTRAVARVSSSQYSTYWALFGVDGADANYRKLLQYDDSADIFSITYANDAAVFKRSDGVLVREDLSSGALAQIDTDRDSMPFYSISEHGAYASIYDEEEEEHVLWHFDSGDTITIEADTRSYAVYSDDEETVAFLREVDGFNKLFITEIDAPDEATDISSGDFTVAEYEFIGNTLFYIANEEANPLQWNLYQYDPTEDEVEVLEEGVAYDDEYLNLKKTHDRIFYQVIDSKNRIYVGYEPAAEERVVFNAAPDTEVSDEITREAIEIADRSAVLLSPENGDDDMPLIVWLHGGPIRQVSVGYHPFFGYAVYDDMLERFAHEAYVLKLDYTGSYGYGKDFVDALEGNIGVEDVRDVERAIDEFRDDNDVDGVYLMGNSYGGYLTLKTFVENPDEIDGVISVSGVTDWIGLATRIPSTPFREHFGGLPNNDTYDSYVDASIYAHIDDVDDDMPMLLVYGEEDTLVPNWQSKEFADFARERGKSVELVGFEDEEHTPQKRESLTEICERAADLISLDGDRCGR